MTNHQITEAARKICAAQALKSSSSDWKQYMSGNWDDTVWMRLVVQGIKRGLDEQAK